ncbi:unnamed protein product [Ostreobium quekettii]|uniref:Nuclear/nucleolar GTPase 2 n=1 Tax=Ostreobium quekettii TaxID=121088 RepID=A0A8S1IYL3_9CHLO|nr:unnamed protein product [Ostreobium quekettii]|eukprot:evm.model.scf_115EXC.7 EVM.evm.TU.scf_115EXC.7   scf_115EXC:45861-48229(+)
MAPSKKAASFDKRKPKHSDDPNRPNRDAKPGMRSAATVRRLKMYKSGGAVRDKKGRVIRQDLQSKELPNTRIVPDRRWFGNTRVVGQKQLEQFREEMSAKAHSAFTVLLRERKLPMQLLKEPDARKSEAERKRTILQVESFDDTFGPSRKRKRPKLSLDTYEDLVSSVGDANQKYEEKVELGRDTNVIRDDDGERKSGRDNIFEKGQSKRIWSELYKVVDSSDVIVQVLDARDPDGTRCRPLEAHVKRNHQFKHMILLLNKCDLVPAWVAKRWLHSFSREYPTLAFHSSITNPFGKGALLSLLRQLARLRSDKKSIAVGFVGYPNVGKSSVINTLRTKKVCKVAPIPGETKVWQYITLMKRINLIDCPGVVHNKTQDCHESTVLKGVVRIEQLEDASHYIPFLMERVKPEYLTRAYGISTWQGCEDFLTQLANKSGKLLKGGDPDLNTAGRMMLLDWQRGRIPFFTLPPDYIEGTDLEKNQASEEGGDGQEGSAKRRDETLVPSKRCEQEIAQSAQAELMRISVELSSQLQRGIPQKKGLFPMEDRMEGGQTGTSAAEETGVGCEVDSVDNSSEAASDVVDGEADLETWQGEERRCADTDSDTDSQIVEAGKGNKGQNPEEDVSDSDSDGYGAEGLSWEAVLKSVQEHEWDLDQNDEEDED